MTDFEKQVYESETLGNFCFLSVWKNVRCRSYFLVMVNHLIKIQSRLLSFLLLSTLFRVLVTRLTLCWQMTIGAVSVVCSVSLPTFITSESWREMEWSGLEWRQGEREREREIFFLATLGLCVFSLHTRPAETDYKKDKLLKLYWCART